MPDPMPPRPPQGPGTFLASLPKDARLQITELITRQHLLESGWGAPPFLGTVQCTMLGEQIEGGYPVGVSATTFPVDFGLMGMGDEPPYVQLGYLAYGIAQMRSTLNVAPPLPDHCAGIIHIAESWALEGDDAEEYMRRDDMQHVGEHPKAYTALSTMFSDLSGNLAIAHLRQGEEPEVRVYDLEDVPPERRLETMQSRLIAPFLVLALELGNRNPG